MKHLGLRMWGDILCVWFDGDGAINTAFCPFPRPLAWPDWLFLVPFFPAGIVAER